MISLMRRVLTTVWEAPSPKLLQSQFPLLVTTGQICFFPNFVFSRIYDVFLGVPFFFLVTAVTWGAAETMLDL